MSTTPTGASTLRHDVPTHLTHIDRPLYGLTVLQYFGLFGLAVSAFFVWVLARPLGGDAPIVLAVLWFLPTAAYLVVRPGGETLVYWLLVARTYQRRRGRYFWRADALAAPTTTSKEGAPRVR